MADPTMYHNPNCSTSRHVLDALKARGHKPRIVAYITDTPSAEDLQALLKTLGAGADAVLRTRGVDEADLAAFAAAKGDAAKTRVLAANPKMIERPIVAHRGKAAVVRPKADTEAILARLGL